MLMAMDTVADSPQGRAAQAARAAAARSRASRARAAARARVDDAIVDGLEDALLHVSRGMTAEAFLKVLTARALVRMTDAGIERPKRVYRDRLGIVRPD